MDSYFKMENENIENNIDFSQPNHENRIKKIKILLDNINNK